MMHYKIENMIIEAKNKSEAVIEYQRQHDYRHGVLPNVSFFKLIEMVSEVDKESIKSPICQKCNKYCNQSGGVIGNRKYIKFWRCFTCGKSLKDNIK